MLQRCCTNGQQVYEKVLGITNHLGKAYQNHNEIISSHLLDRVLSKREKRNVSKVVEKKVLLYIIGRNVKFCSCYGKQY